MQLSNKSLSEMNSQDQKRTTNSQSALTASHFAARQMKIKNDVIQRLLASTKINADSADISELDIDVKNKSMILASSKPTPLKILREQSSTV